MDARVMQEEKRMDVGRMADLRIANYIYQKIVKRCFDVILSAAALIFLSPLLLIAAIAIKLEDGGPVIYKRYCVGRNEKKYIMYKFRSMKVNAEELITFFDEHQKEKYYSGVKLEDDFRITKIGKILRKTSIDELPQFFTVIKGDMSLVGPRPVIEREAMAYGERKEKLLSVLPGITGIWQTEGRGKVPYLSQEAMEMQLLYIDKCDWKFDIKILMKTFGLVLKREGAR